MRFAPSTLAIAIAMATTTAAHAQQPAPFAKVNDTYDSASEVDTHWGHVFSSAVAKAKALAASVMPQADQAKVAEEFTSEQAPEVAVKAEAKEPTPPVVPTAVLDPVIELAEATASAPAVPPQPIVDTQEPAPAAVDSAEPAEKVDTYDVFVKVPKAVASIFASKLAADIPAKIPAPEPTPAISKTEAPDQAVIAQEPVAPAADPIVMAPKVELVAAAPAPAQESGPDPLLSLSDKPIDRSTIIMVDSKSAEVAESIAEQSSSVVKPKKTDAKYFFANGRFIMSDSKRDADNGFGGSAGMGFGIQNNLSVETHVFANAIDSGNDLKDQMSRGFGADLVYTFGERNKASAYALAGLGVAYNTNVRKDESSVDPYVNIGVGMVVPVGDDLKLRGEVRQAYDMVSEGVSDTIMGLGLEVDYGRGAIIQKAGPAPFTERQVFDTDTDSDGVPDNKDLCPNTVEGTYTDSKGCAVRNQVVRFDKVFFAFNSADLLEKSLDGLNVAAKMLAEQKDLTIEVAGHTDNQGDEKVNLQMSKARAQSVVKALEQLGVDPSRMRSAGYGSIAPIADNATPNGRADNRRVEIRID